MHQFKTILSRLIAGTMAMLLVSAYPLPVFADGTTAVVCPQVSGTTAPTGASAVTFTYNSKTCLWENDYYTWNPVTKYYTPKFAQPYTYNSATGLYDAPSWIFDAAKAKYVQATISVSTPPAGATVIGGPPAPAQSISNTGAGSSNNINNGSGAASGGSISNTGAGSSNGINTNGNASTILTDANGVSVSNLLNSSASSGDATISLNTSAGSATSGDASAAATLINLLQSNTSLQANVATFTYNIYGNVQGDLLIDPSQLSGTDPSASNNLAVNSSTSASINNSVDVSAASGDATVSRNTTAGGATSGTADAVVQIINVINSIISSGQSFVGTINIYGDFNGDILLPQDTLNQILASNYPTVNATLNPDGTITTSGAGSTNAINNNGGSTTDINNTSSTGINNDVTLSAASGDATVSRNTTAGGATSGTAGTNLVLLNLTGQQIICGDALLVFVNVLGNWVGMIVNAPAGSTAAALGGGSCSTTAMPSANTNISTSNNLSINNQVDANAQSGNALVSENTTAGNARSGNATASANIANIANSSLSFASWFGVLFINVFGNWQGSFGINTSAGNPPAAISTAPAPNSSPAVKAVKVFSFVPEPASGSSTYSVQPISSVSNPGASATDSNKSPVVLSAATSHPSGAAAHNTSMFWVAGSLFFLAGVISAEEAVSRRKEAARSKFRSYVNSITVQPFKRD